MRKCSASMPAHFFFASITLFFLLFISRPIRAQEKQESLPQIRDAVIAKLAPLTYPPLARQTRIAGDVELKLEVRPDGSVASAVAVSGHPLLVQPALDNALKSQFVCESCGDNVHAYRLIYTFKLDSPNMSNNEKKEINPEHPGLRVMQSAGRITITDYPFQEIDFGSEIRRVRAIKCLYLWKCGWRERDFDRKSHLKERE